LEWVEVKQEAVTEYNAWIQEGLKKTVWHQDRKAWYNNADGVNIALWPFRALYQGIVYSSAPDWSHFQGGRRSKYILIKTALLLQLLFVSLIDFFSYSIINIINR
jgi:hypothetical protein